MSPRLLLAALILAALGGCSTLTYYAQAARGQLSMLWAARPVDAWLRDAGTPDELRSRLANLGQIREFASRELGLPDNGSYRRYADLGRPYVVWNLVATPPFSLAPRQWCFPFAGCVAYKGWFSEAPAQAAAEAARAEGYDVVVYGVTAYSTLGWFDDPALNTFIRYPRPEVARIVFHELAHQLVYAGGDTAFNESFATAVEDEGVRRWLRQHGTQAEREEYQRWQERKAAFLALIGRARARLEAVYAQALPPAQMRERKAEVFGTLREEYQALKDTWGGFAGYDRWFAQPLSNAHLASLATYHEWVPAFQRLLEQQAFDLAAFYREVKYLRGLPERERRNALGRL